MNFGHKLLLFFGCVAVSSCLQGMMPVAGYHRLTGLPAVGARVINDNITNNPNFRRSFHQLMIAAEIANRIAQKERAGKSATPSELRAFMFQLRGFTDQLTPNASRARDLVDALVKKNKALSTEHRQRVLVDVVQPSAKKSEEAFEQNLSNRERRRHMIEQVLAVRDVLLDNMNTSSRAAYVNQFGTHFVKDRYLIVDPNKKIFVGWKTLSALGMLLGAAALGAGGHSLTRVLKAFIKPRRSS